MHQSNIYLFLPCGRAGQNSCQSRAHLFVTSKKLSDRAMQQYCALGNTEDCLRNILLEGLDCYSLVQENNSILPYSAFCSRTYLDFP